MNDNDIIKALELCESPTCECTGECPMFNNGTNCISDCRGELHKNALDLINRLKAEIERLKDMVAHWLMDVLDAMSEAVRQICRSCDIRPREYPYVMPFDPGDAFRLQPNNRWKAVVMYGEFPAISPGGKEKEREYAEN